MDGAAVAEVECALIRAGISGPALAGIMAMVKTLVKKPQLASSCSCSHIEPIEDFRPDELASLSGVARRFLKDSLRRGDVVGTPVEDASWNMMLAIYADAEEGGDTSTTSACYASGVAPTTALRHIERLRRDGLITKHEDPFDGRRTLLRPTSSAVKNMSDMIRSFCIPRPGPSAN